MMMSPLRLQQQPPRPHLVVVMQGLAALLQKPTQVCDAVANFHPIVAGNVQQTHV
jgi:hypothetical protein